jgi:hypothetical protein
LTDDNDERFQPAKLVADDDYDNAPLFITTFVSLEPRYATPSEPEKALVLSVETGDWYWLVLGFAMF